MNTDNFRIGSGSLSIGNNDVGGTTESGMEITYEPNVHLHTSGQYGSTPVKASLIGMKLLLKVTVAEQTLQNIADLFAGVSKVGSSIKFGGVAGAEIVGKALVMTPFDGSPVWTFKNAVPTSNVTVKYTPKDERVYEVQFTAMVDSTAAQNANVATIS